MTSIFTYNILLETPSAQITYDLLLIKANEFADLMIKELDEIAAQKDVKEFKKLDGKLYNIRISLFAKGVLETEFILKGGIGKIIALMRHEQKTLLTTAFDCLKHLMDNEDAQRAMLKKQELYLDVLDLTDA